MKHLNILPAFTVLMAVIITLILFLFKNFDKSSTIYQWVIFVISITVLIISAGLIGSETKKDKSKKNKIFIIYAREDIDMAQSLVQKLKQAGMNPWIDIDNIKPGENWKQRVSEALDESFIALLLVSKNINKKGFVQQEMSVAFNTMQQCAENLSPVIPIKIDDTKLPDKLSNVHWVDFKNDIAINNLINVLKDYCGQVKS